MEVNSINSNFVNGNININKTGKSENVPESTEKELVPDSDDFAPSTRVSVDKTQYGNETQFAHQVYNKIKQSSINDLSAIKTKMQNGSYLNDEVNKAVISGLINSL